MARLTASSSGKKLKRRAQRLASLVSSLRKTVKAGPKRTTRPAAKTKAATPLPPIKRTSVVRKPARGPSVKASRSGASERRKTPRAPARPTQATHASPASAMGAPAWSTAPAAAAPWAPPPAAQPPASAPSEARYSIPTGYGDDRIVIMVKDPWWLYAYWEIQPSIERATRSQLLPHEVAGLQSILRVHDVTGVDFPAQPAHRSFDIPLSGLATNWFIHADAPNRSFIVDIGFLTNTGRFLLLARSNRVTTPRFGPSEIIDEAWMTTDDEYWKLFGASAGMPGSSPAPWSGAMPQLFSGNRPAINLAGATRPSIVRGFWCRINADLVIHGATEPRSTVLVQGQPAAVRKDGSFSLRLALPTGTQTITIEVTSPDGRQMKTVTPIVTLAWSGALSTESTTESLRGRSRPRAAGGG